MRQLLSMAQTLSAQILFQVNEQKYFASTDGSYIDQDIHRIWPTFTVTTTDKTSGTFKTQAGTKRSYRYGIRIHDSQSNWINFRDRQGSFYIKTAMIL